MEGPPRLLMIFRQAWRSFHFHSQENAMITAERECLAKKQTTRMKKVACSSCGCLIRMTRHWIELCGCPTCACGAVMERAAEND